MSAEPKQFNPLKERIHEIIFEADTRAGKNFDILLLIAIVASVVLVMLESVPSYNEEYGLFFTVAEWILTAFFTIEYILRLYCVYKPIKYATSFFGIIDLVSILPSFLSFIFPGSHSLIVIRGLRLMRIFRIFKLASFLSQGQVIIDALKASRAKITVFVLFIFLTVCIFGSIMYLVEGTANPDEFDSIPRSVYWAIVTLTTVGYGDISPSTPFGQFIAAIIMIAGYAVIAVPTGIVTTEIMNNTAKDLASNPISTQTCRYCSAEGHDADAEFCKYCGEKLNENHIH